MEGLPSGTVTMLFTDIEGSTHMLQRIGVKYAAVLDDHRALLTAAVETNEGAVVGTQGDAMFAVFSEAPDAVAAALGAQLALAQHPWPAHGRIRVRMGIHTGDALLRNGDYVGLAVHQAARICSAVHGGQVVVSDTTAATAADDLPPGAGLLDLGHHRLKDLPEPLHLWQLAHRDLPFEFPRLRSDAVPGNLPRQITRFVGRRTELDEAAYLLQTGTRLLTLTGPGGCGKTRLALELAAEVVDEFPHGAWLVELGGVGEPELVDHVVAAALDVREEQGRPVAQTLCEAIGTKHLLLLMDNCEHLVAACAELADALLRSCPEVRVLVTSQEALAIAGEVVVQVPPLANKEGVELFADRAAARRPGFELTAEHMDHVIAICDRLDGIPLAIELAAARVNVLTPRQIAARLDDQFRLLTGGNRTALPRQQTLRATVDWSYGLLGEEERVLLRRLSIFTGGWTLETAAAVCSGADLEDDAVLDGLDRLVTRPLVAAEEQDGAARYRLLQTIRQYGQQKLDDAGETEQLRNAHLAWFADLVVRAEPDLTGPGQAAWLARLAAEYDNLRAALEWAATSELAAVFVSLAADLWRFWLVRGLWSEGRAWLRRALAADPLRGDAARARALTGAGDLAAEQGDYEVAEPLLLESLELWQELGDREGVAESLNHLGNLDRGRFEFDRARARLIESLEIRRELGNERGMAVSLRNLGLVAALQRDHDTARARYDEALPLARRTGDKRVIATVARALALARFTDGERVQARELAEEGLALMRELGDRQGIAELLTVLAGMSTAEGDASTGASMMEEALAIWATLGSVDAVAWTHTTLGEMALDRGDATTAAPHLAAGLEAWRRLGDEAAVARVANLAGWAACLAGQCDAALPMLDEAVALCRRRADTGELSAALHSRGETARLAGRTDQARADFEESLAAARASGWKRLLWWPMHGLAALARAAGDLDTAESLLREALALQPTRGRMEGTVDCLDELAGVASDRGDVLRAAQLLGASDAIRKRAGVLRQPARMPAYDDTMSQISSALDPDAVGSAQRAGAEMPLTELI